MGMEAMFSKIASAAATTRSDSFRLGTKGVATVKKCEQKNTYKKGNAAIFEYVIKSCDAQQGVTPHAVGSTVGIVYMIDHHEAAAGACKANILGTLGANESDTNAEDLAKVIGEVFGAKQAFVGMDVAYETYPWTTKKGQNITLVKFSHVPLTPEKIAEQRAQILGK